MDYTTQYAKLIESRKNLDRKRKDGHYYDNRHIIKIRIYRL